MNTSDKKTINLIAVIFIIIFIFISCFNCFEIRNIMLIKQDFLMPGDYYVSEEKSNNILLMLALGTVQIVFLCMKNKRLYIASFILALLSLLITVSYASLYNLVIDAYALIGGIAYEECVITWFGYGAIVFGALNCLVQIMSLNKRNE